jgi:phenylpropionate dioxygenase-like ring-hydroxylating dioxygenase large terminal subunit
MFLTNCWYVAGWSTDLAPGATVARTFLGKPVVLFRTASGTVGALEDRCCHRAMPLSRGTVCGESIRCIYHGLEYDTGGACTRIPAQEKIPPNARVRSYPLVEKHALLWIWMGEADQANPATIPGHAVHEEPKWAWRSAHYPVKGNWELLIDNLMDLSHLPYIHPHTIGGNPELHFKTKTVTKIIENERGAGVWVQRHMPSSQPPPTYIAAKGFKGPVDRWQEIEFEPVLLRIHTGGCDVGTGAYEGKRAHGFSMMGFHGITPETETTTHYFWSMATNVLEAGIPDLVFEQTARTFKEDQEVLELQQRRMAEEPDRALLDIASDVGANNARRLLRQLMRRELSSGTA